MISFRLTLVLCALVFGQSLASTIQSSTAVEGKEIDALVKIVDLLEKLGDKAIDIASKLVDYNIKNYDDLPNRIGKHINAVLQKIADHIVVYVDKVRKVVNKDASTVLQCAETSLKAAFSNSADDVQATLTCVQPDLKKVLVILPPVLKELNAVLKKVEGVTVGLKKCDGLPLKELACVADIANKSLNAAKGLPKLVIDTYRNIKAALKDLYANNKKCLHGVLDKIMKDAVKDLNKFGTCSRK